MGRKSSNSILIRVIGLIAGASVALAKPYPATYGLKQPQPTGTFILDPTGTYKLGSTIGTLPLDPTGTYKLGRPTSLDTNSDLVPSRSKREAGPDPFFTGRRNIPDGIYPASEVYPAYGPTGIVSTGGSYFSRPLRPTGIFTTSGTTFNGISRY